MKCSLSPLERLNVIALLPAKGGKYTMAMSGEVEEKCKLSVDELRECASEGPDGELDPDKSSILKLREGKEKEIEFSRWAGEMLELLFKRLEEAGELDLYQYRLWGKLTGKDMTPEQDGPFPGLDDKPDKETKE